MVSKVYRNAEGEGKTGTREQRGRELFLRGGVEYRVDGTLVVPSASRPNVKYEVHLDAEHVSDRCGCEDCQIRGAVCLHQHAAEWRRAEWRREARRNAERAIARREERVRFTPEQVLRNLERMSV